MKGSPRSNPSSRTRTTLSCWIADARRASSSSIDRYTLSVARCLWGRLIATSGAPERPSTARPRYTVAMPPEAISSSRSYPPALPSDTGAAATVGGSPLGTIGMDESGKDDTGALKSKHFAANSSRPAANSVTVSPMLAPRASLAASLAALPLSLTLVLACGGSSPQAPGAAAPSSSGSGSGSGASPGAPSATAAGDSPATSAAANPGPPTTTAAIPDGG